MGSAPPASHCAAPGTRPDEPGGPRVSVREDLGAGVCPSAGWLQARRARRDTRRGVKGHGDETDGARGEAGFVAGGRFGAARQRKRGEKRGSSWGEGLRRQDSGGTATSGVRRGGKVCGGRTAEDLRQAGLVVGRKVQGGETEDARGRSGARQGPPAPQSSGPRVQAAERPRAHAAERGPALTQRREAPRSCSKKAPRSCSGALITIEGGQFLLLTRSPENANPSKNSGMPWLTSPAEPWPRKRWATHHWAAKNSVGLLKRFHGRS